LTSDFSAVTGPVGLGLGSASTAPRENLSLALASEEPILPDETVKYSDSMIRLSGQQDDHQLRPTSLA
jgi:hypothetical protein